MLAPGRNVISLNVRLLCAVPVFFSRMITHSATSFRERGVKCGTFTPEINRRDRLFAHLGRPHERAYLDSEYGAVSTNSSRPETV